MVKRFTAFAALLLLLCTPLPALANAAEPPGLTVIVSGPPEGLELSITPNAIAGPIPLRPEIRGWEAQYRYFYHSSPNAGVSDLDGPVLHVEWDGGSFECQIPEEYFGYNNQVTLDLANQTVSEGQRPYRAPLLAAMRVLLTLLIEGAVFYLFGYRAKRSWRLFLLVNLITQAALNALFIGASGYWHILYVIVELAIFHVEALVFKDHLEEHGKRRAVLCALAANAASLVLGGLMLTYLPV